ncbi:hypothetical protein Vretifemale_18472 [Volvox reticuliferus]|uniref:gamma-glutamylcyclotransferase n=2 Tax=Volvox reticuliferus TaxID=1737510 RepID=A0A8J4FY31_9CHLO|nr:hypothetical protein Vretifemale_18472 [Volvox reticuliferus]
MSISCLVHGYLAPSSIRGIPFLEPGFATVERVDEIDGGRPPQLSQAPTDPTPPTGSMKPPSMRSNRWGSEVHGVLHRISVNDWIQIMVTEGVASDKSGYRVVEVEVTQYDGRRVRALTLEGQPPSLHSTARPVLPSRRYLELLRDGARHYGLDPEYITYLNSLDPYEGDGWNAAVGRAILLAVLVPLTLPLLPAVFLVRVAYNDAREAAQQAKGGDRAVTPSSNSDLPAHLLRPPLVLPAFASSYMRVITYVAWALHDVLEGTPLGNSSSAVGNGNSKR